MLLGPVLPAPGKTNACIENGRGASWPSPWNWDWNWNWDDPSAFAELPGRRPGRRPHRPAAGHTRSRPEKDVGRLEKS